MNGYLSNVDPLIGVRRVAKDNLERCALAYFALERNDRRLIVYTFDKWECRYAAGDAALIDKFARHHFAKS